MQEKVEMTGKCHLDYKKDPYTSSKERPILPQFRLPNKGSFVNKHLCKYCIVLNTQKSDDI